MKSSVYLFVLFCFITFSGNAQTFPSELWHDGQITLVDKSVKHGNIKYDLENQTVLLTAGQRNEAYDASQIISFSFLQESINVRRTFYSLPFAIQNNYRRPVFFELIVAGKMTLLVREHVVFRSHDNMNTFNSRYRYRDYSDLNSSRSYLAYKMFLVKEDGVIRESTGRKNDVLNEFGDARSELKRFVKKERLKLDNVDDVAKLVEHYNKVIN